MRQVTLSLALAALGAALSFFTLVAQAGTTAKVNCDLRGPIGKIANVLNRLDPAATNVVNVRGHCHENLVIRGFDRLSLIAESGTVIEDASAGQASVVDIEDSQRVVLEGFIIHGGSNGVTCLDFSFCRLTGLTIEQAGGVGLTVTNSQGQLYDSTIQGSGGDGIFLFGGKLQWHNVTVSNAQGNGVTVQWRSQLNGPNNTVTGSGFAGIFVQGSSIATGPNVVTGNGQQGIVLITGSNALLYSTTVTDNKWEGVRIEDVSAVAFQQGGTYTGNGTENKAPDIRCGLQTFNVARFFQATQYGSTNCPVLAPFP
jgi:hypothetical protein